MSEENHDLLVLEEGQEAGVVQSCCSSGSAAKV